MKLRLGYKLVNMPGLACTIAVFEYLLKQIRRIINPTDKMPQQFYVHDSLPLATNQDVATSFDYDAAFRRFLTSSHSVEHHEYFSLTKVDVNQNDGELRVAGLFGYSADTLIKLDNTY